MNRGMDIENRSMHIIDGFLADTSFPEEELPIVRRILHTTGDPEYRKIISIKNDFVKKARNCFLRNRKFIAIRI